jgi:hypothetical protein
MIRTPLVAVEQTPADLAGIGADIGADEEWRFASSSIAPSRLLVQSHQRRWETRFMAAFHGLELVGLLSTHRLRGATFPAAYQDPAVVAPELFSGHDRPADTYLLIGGHADLVAGPVTRAGLDEVTAAHVGTLLADAAFAAAREQGLTGAALYVRDAQRDQFAAGGSRLGAAKVGEFAELDVAGRSDREYLASLNHSRRSVVRRDWQQYEAAALRCETVAAGSVLEEAAPLVADVNGSHGVADHPRLALMRLTQWAAERLGERVAFVVRNEAGTMLAVCFGCRWGEVLELYEIGLAERSDSRRLAYVEAMIYAPRRFAARHGCARVQLGLDSTHPKGLRGARFSPVWAIGDQSGKRPA